MNEVLVIGLACGAGMGLGAFYFSGLWFTVRRLHLRRCPGIWVTVSFILRTMVTIAGFHLAMAGEWQRLAGCVGGFLLARTIMLWRLSPVGTKITQEQEGLHGTQEHQPGSGCLLAMGSRESQRHPALYLGDHAPPGTVLPSGDPQAVR